MKSLQEIKSTLTQNKNNLFSEYPIKSIAIFGSYAKKQQNNESDYLTELIEWLEVLLANNKTPEE